MTNKKEQIQQLNNDYQIDPYFSYFSSSRYVAGTGNLNAHTVLIGEAPGVHENALATPFIGASGKILNDIFEANGVSRDDFYLTNVIKYRPPLNREPLEHEVVKAIPYLRREISIIKPNNIVLFGRVPCRAFFPGINFYRLRGTVKTLGRYNIYITYHPAAVLHNTKDRQETYEALQKVFSIITLKEF